VNKAVAIFYPQLGILLSVSYRRTQQRRSVLTLRNPSQLQTERVKPAQRCTWASSVELLEGTEQLEDTSSILEDWCAFLSVGDRAVVALLGSISEFNKLF
jgi:hypothetical protein